MDLVYEYLSPIQNEVKNTMDVKGGHGDVT